MTGKRSADKRIQSIMLLLRSLSKDHLNNINFSPVSRAKLSDIETNPQFPTDMLIILKEMGECSFFSEDSIFDYNWCVPCKIKDIDVNVFQASNFDPMPQIGYLNEAEEKLLFIGTDGDHHSYFYNTCYKPWKIVTFDYLNSYLDFCHDDLSGQEKKTSPAYDDFISLIEEWFSPFYKY